MSWDGIHSRSKGESEAELINSCRSVTFLCCSPFLAEKTHHTASVSQRDDQSGEYSGSLGWLHDERTQFATAVVLHAPTSVPKRCWDVAAADKKSGQIDLKAPSRALAFSGREQKKFRLQINSFLVSFMCVCVCVCVCGCRLEACSEWQGEMEGGGAWRCWSSN